MLFWLSPAVVIRKYRGLHSGIATAFGHNIIEFPIRLGMQLIEYDAVGVEPVLVPNIGGQYLVYAAGWQKNKPFLRIEYLDPL